MGTTRTRPRPRLTLDAGALIGLERRDQRSVTLLEEHLATRGQVVIPAGALAQAWRDGSQQVTLARLVSSSDTEVVPLDSTDAQSVGVLLSVSRTSDVTDAHVVLVARRTNSPVATSDPDDLRALDPKVSIIAL